MRDIHHPPLTERPGTMVDGAKFVTPPRQHSVVKLYLICVTISGVFLALIAPENMPLEQQAVGIALGGLCWLPAAIYIASNVHGIPGFEMLCLFFGLQYCLSIFVVGENVLQFAVGDVIVAPEDITAALALSWLGMAGFQVGYYQMRRLADRRSMTMIRLSLDPKKSYAYAIFVCVTATALDVGGTVGVLTPENIGPLASFSAVIAGQIAVSIAILVWLSFNERYGQKAKIALILAVGAPMAMGLVRGNLESLLIPVATLVMARWYHSRRMPWRLGAIGLILFVLFQPAKQAYRAQKWNSADGSASIGLVQSSVVWFDLATSYWLDSFSGSGPPVRDALSLPFRRADFTSILGYTYSLTPNPVPYKYGSTYSYFLVSWIPRYFWPEKPIAQQVNKDYAVDYGIQTPEGTETSMMSMPVLIEAFVNFGTVGIAVIMALNGVVLGTLDRLMNRPGSGIGSQCIYLGTVVLFLNGMGSNTAALYGGLVQNTICNYIIINWSSDRSVL